MSENIEKRPRYVDWPYVIGLVLLPVAIMLLLFGVKLIQSLSRFDPVYFAEPYLERYGAPGAVAIELESALRDGDEQLMAELMATRRDPEPMAPQPSLIFIFLLGTDGDYFEYLYLNTTNYNRVIEYVTEQDGRYVVSPEDLYYYIDSGRWVAVAAPIAATWWSLVIVYTAATYVYRRTSTTRRQMFGG